MLKYEGPKNLVSDFSGAFFVLLVKAKEGFPGENIEILATYCFGLLFSVLKPKKHTLFDRIVLFYDLIIEEFNWKLYYDK